MVASWLHSSPSILPKVSRWLHSSPSVFFQCLPAAYIQNQAIQEIRWALEGLGLWTCGEIKITKPRYGREISTNSRHCTVYLSVQSEQEATRYIEALHGQETEVKDDVKDDVKEEVKEETLPEDKASDEKKDDDEENKEGKKDSASDEKKDDEGESRLSSDEKKDDQAEDRVASGEEKEEDAEHRVASGEEKEEEDEEKDQEECDPPERRFVAMAYNEMRRDKKRSR
eukprot:s975_g46.t1